MYKEKKERERIDKIGKISPYVDPAKIGWGDGHSLCPSGVGVSQLKPKFNG